MALGLSLAPNQLEGGKHPKGHSLDNQSCRNRAATRPSKIDIDEWYACTQTRRASRWKTENLENCRCMYSVLRTLFKSRDRRRNLNKPVGRFWPQLYPVDPFNASGVETILMITGGRISLARFDYPKLGHSETHGLNKRTERMGKGARLPSGPFGIQQVPRPRRATAQHQPRLSLSA